VKTRLERLIAPAYWSRWAVVEVASDDQIGTVEKRGGFAHGWYAYALTGLIGPRYDTRKAAVAAVVAITEQRDTEKESSDGPTHA
jgi:hypothetical protein